MTYDKIASILTVVCFFNEYFIMNQEAGTSVPMTCQQTKISRKQSILKREKKMLRVLLLVVVACWCAESFFISSNKASSSMILFNVKTPLVANGKRIEADPGSSLIAACTKLGLRVPTKCKKGECGTCTVTVAGSKYRACIAKVPPGTYLC